MVATAYQIVSQSIRNYLEFHSAYQQCDPAIREVVDDMIAIYASPDATEDEKRRAISTIMEAMFPSLGVDFIDGQEAAKVRPETQKREQEMDAEEAQFAENLRRLMGERNLTQEQLAEQAGVKQPAISNMLNRQSRPQERTVRRFAEILDVKPEELWPPLKQRGE